MLASQLVNSTSAVAVVDHRDWGMGVVVRSNLPAAVAGRNYREGNLEFGIAEEAGTSAVRREDMGVIEGANVAAEWEVVVDMKKIRQPISMGMSPSVLRD